ncbi:MAG: exonuclease domain-containing protein [Pseudomonadota bacterium]|nr:exonuclease domain-containing protein [Pseudomonadota bacterium]
MDAAEALPQDLVFVDLETTGGNAAYHRITEVGIVRVERGELIEEWSSLLNPQCPIPTYIEEFTGITNAMVENAPLFADIAALLREKLDGAVFVAHNARFDYSFLRSEFRRIEVNFAAKVLCTVKLSRRLFPEYPRHNLDAVMERHGLICSARHRALGDARVLHDLWFKLRRELPDETLRAATKALLAAPRLPAHLPTDLADELPEGSGVYRFFGEGEVLLYVGRSRSLRTRVLSHFAATDANAAGRKLAAAVRRIDWLETAGELGAALREGDWIKTQKPLHNRRVKSKAGAFTLRISMRPSAGGATAGVAAAAGAAQVAPLAIHGLQRQELNECFGLFQSEKDARKALRDIAGAKQLCLKVLGLEQSAGSCFAYQVGKCKGACIGKEPLMLHNMRLQLALSALKLKTWPFPGRIALRERAPRGSFVDENRTPEFHVLDQWTYLGTAHSEEELAALGDADSGAGGSSFVFDVDVYRILVRYFSSNPKLDWHDLRDKSACT